MNIFWKNTVTSGSFTSAANWVQSVVPGANDVAELTTSGATVIDNHHDNRSRVKSRLDGHSCGQRTPDGDGRYGSGGQPRHH